MAIWKATRRLLVSAGWVAWAAGWGGLADTEPVRGPFWSGTIMRSRDRMAAAKGLAITLGADGKHYVAYDLDTLRVAAGWGGDFLNFGNTLTKIEWPPPPSIRGQVSLETDNGPGWADTSGDWVDPRDHAQGPLPKSWAHYQGLYLDGNVVVLKYSVGPAVVLESPRFVDAGGQALFLREFEFEKTGLDLSLLLADRVEGAGASGLLAGDAPVTVTLAGGGTLTVAGVSVPAGARVETQGGRLILRLPKVVQHRPFALAFSTNSSPAGFALAAAGKLDDLRKFTKGGPAHWTQTVATVGKLGSEEGPYAVDTLSEPTPNPYQTKTFFGGFDFLPDGRAVICTFHGDVWLVSGIDQGLSHLVWKRFASGLFQPLGVKVQHGRIYVAGRDQITRLEDLNGDGEADFYENFNNDTVVTANYHEFVLDLHTDSKGNFFYAKGAPWEPAVTSPHQGTLLKVSPDGSKLEVFATGLRAPNGMTVGPDDTILISDNQGHWMPSSKLNLVHAGDFLGMTPAAHRQIQLRYPDGREIVLDPSNPEARAKYGLKGWEGAMPIPARYDEPLCWLPMRWDNSSGGQTYVTSDKWGPWKGAPLFLSYGKCLLYGVLMDEVDGVAQASMAPFGLRFDSGVMRARFNPNDGQLYVCGLKGWQTSATREGGFYRVRYTGKPVRMPVGAHAAKNGLEITWSTPLDPKTATDIGRYSVEEWNYRYTGAYGSPEVSVKDPKKEVHDHLEVKSARVSPDGRRLFLEVAGLQTADQFSVRYDVAAADGAEMQSEVVGTIHKLGPEIGALR